jgi:excinuclease ABC subunit B
MAKKPDAPKKTGKTPTSKAPNSKASRPDVKPIGPALAELLNPAINRGESGLGSSTGLQPPPDNSWDRRAGGEAAAHRARASTRGKSDDVGKRDTSSSSSRGMPPPNPPPQAGEGSQRQAPGTDDNDPSGTAQPASPLPLAGEGQGGGASASPALHRPGLDESPQANYGTAATIPTLDPERAARWKRSASRPPPTRWKT